MSKKSKGATKKVKLPQADILSTTNCSSDSCMGCCKKKNRTLPMVILLGLIILGIVAVKQGYVVSAIVNNRPILRFELNRALLSRFGKQTLDNMVSEVLIAQEAKKAGVSVTQKEIDQKEEEILLSFGGKVTLDELLTYQGMTKADFDSQVRLQILVSKLLGKDIVVSDQEVADYIITNKSTLVATDEAGLNEEAKQALTDQKISEKIQPWFSELKSKAKIFIFN